MTIDEFCKIAGATGPFAAAFVAAVAVVVTAQQSKRTSELSRRISERQIQIEEAKIRSELYDRRYAAWQEMSKFAMLRFMAIHGMQSVESSLDVYTSEHQAGWLEAAEKMFFLFGDDVNKAIKDLDSSFSQFFSAKARELSAPNYKAGTVLGEQTLSAFQNCDLAMSSLKSVTKHYMEPNHAPSEDTRSAQRVRPKLSARSLWNMRKRVARGTG